MKIVFLSIFSSILMLTSPVRSEPVFIDFDYSYNYGYEFDFDFDDYTYHYHVNAYTYDNDSVEFLEPVVVNSACQQPQSPIVFGSNIDRLNNEDVFIKQSNIIIDNSFRTKCSDYRSSGLGSWMFE